METPFQVISGPALSKKCDYSFGDHHAAMDLMGAMNSGVVNLIGGFMKEASPRNTEFLEKCKQFEGKIMTLYIDNVRLYNRPIMANAGPDAQWIQFLLENNNLLALCESLPKNKFIIFSHQEDTIIEGSIKIPENVLGVYAVNAEAEVEKLFPFPFGVQRQMGVLDNRQQVLTENIIEDKVVQPKKLFYINGDINRNPERPPLAAFSDKEWATTRFHPLSMYYSYDHYQVYLDEMKDHKFVACPRGHDNCYDTHKIWESLYLRRVPVFRDWPYYRRMLKGFPVLFVKEWSDVTEKLLRDNNHLFEEAKTMSLKRLELNFVFKSIVNSYK